MTEEIKGTATTVDDAQGDIDYKALYETEKANSRKWENRSKANKAKADELDALKAGEASVEERIAAIEAENQRLKAERERATLVKAVAASSGVPESVVSILSATDEETLTAQTQIILEAFKSQGGAPVVPETGQFNNANEPKDSKRAFAHELFSSRR